MDMSRSREIRYWLLYLLSTSVAIFLILECSVRLLQFAPALPGYLGVEDPYLPYKPRPRSVVFDRTSEFECEYRHNSFGFRDVEHSTSKPKDVFRILALGDSFTYGTGVSLQEVYLYKLEEMLNRREGKHPKVEIIKAGIYRYFPEPERILLEHYGVNFLPDLILVAFLPNDIVDTHAGIDAVKVNQTGQLVTSEAAGMGSVITSLYIHSHVFRILLSGYNSFRVSGKSALPGEDIYKPNGFFERDWKTVEVEYQKILRIADSINASVVFVHIPQRGPWEGRHSYPAERLYEWSSKHGAEFVDTLPAMKEDSKGRKLYYQKDGHCRAAGHAVIAEVLFKKLTEKKIIP